MIHGISSSSLQHSGQTEEDYAEQWYGQAWGLFCEGNFDAAEGCCISALRHKPNYPRALHLLGLIAIKRNRFEAAREYYKQAILSGVTGPEIYCDLGDALQKLSKFDEAVECYRRAIDLAPAYADAYYKLGVSLESYHRAKAVAAFRKAIALDSTHGDAYLHLGSLLGVSGRVKTAIPYLRRAVELMPDSMEAKQRLTASCQVKHDTNDALNATEKK